MKRKIAIYAIAVLTSILMFGCVNGDENTEITTQEEFKGWIKKIEVTKENWEEFFKIVESRIDEKNSLDELTGNYNIHKCLINHPNVYVKDKCVFRFSVDSNYADGLYDSNGTRIENYVFDDRGSEIEELHQVVENDLTYYSHFFQEPNYHVIETIESKYLREDGSYSLTKNTINSITLIKVKGNVLTVEVPEEAWNKPDKTGKKYIQLENAYGESKYVKLYEDYSTDIIKEDEKKYGEVIGLNKWFDFVVLDEKFN